MVRARMRQKRELRRVGVLRDGHLPGAGFRRVVGHGHGRKGAVQEGRERAVVGVFGGIREVGNQRGCAVAVATVPAWRRARRAVGTRGRG